MTIDEAITKYKEIANTDANCPAHCNISCDKCVQESKQLAEWLEEIQQYRAIGTVEECLAAVEKMKPKKTAIEAIKVHICPVCGFSGIYDYCGNCGQRVQMLSD